MNFVSINIINNQHKRLKQQQFIFIYFFQLPKINDQLGYLYHDQCWIVGYKYQLIKIDYGKYLENGGNNSGNNGGDNSGDNTKDNAKNNGVNDGGDDVKDNDVNNVKDNAQVNDLDQDNVNIVDNVKDNVKDNIKDNIKDNVVDNVVDNIKDNIKDKVVENVIKNDQKQKLIETINLTQHKQNQKMQLKPDPLGRELMKYGEIKKYAQQNQLDIYSIDTEKKEVSLKNLRESIYRKYYQKHIYKKNSTGKKYTQIRLSQKIEQKDIATKVNNIKNLISRGEFKFKIITENDTQNCQKTLKNICEMLNHEFNLQKQKIVIKNKNNRQAQKQLQRLVITLNFEQQSKIDYELVNKKWIRHCIKSKITKQQQIKPSRKSKFNFDKLYLQPIQIQKSAIQLLQKTNTTLPQGFQDYGKFTKQAKIYGKNALFKDLSIGNQFSFKKQSHKNKIESIQQQYSNNKKQQSSSEDITHQSQLSQQQSQSQQTQQNSINTESFQQYLAKTSKLQKEPSSMIGIRTVQDILNQLQKVKSDKVELSAFDQYKIERLQAQLKTALQLAGYRQKY